MTLEAQLQKSAKEEPSKRWLLVVVGSEELAVRFDYLLRIIDDAQIFSVPLSGDYFQGLIYYQEQAVPVINWKAISELKNQGNMFLILEEGKDLIALQVKEVGGIFWAEPEKEQNSLWYELDSGKRALRVENLFASLRQGSFKAKEQGGENG